MRRQLQIGYAFLCILLCAAAWAASAAVPEDRLPEGVKAVWDLDKAYRETTPTRERVCINGLWRWQPAAEDANTVPADGWGHYKVPGPWPGGSRYMQRYCQTAHSQPPWDEDKLAAIATAWYQREITIPREWTGRRIALSAEYVNSFASVYIDGKQVGEVAFPSGEVDLTPVCRPGSKHLLSMLVLAMPLKDVMISFGDSNAPKGVKGSVTRRGLCGDVYLTGEPAGPRITDVKVDTSVRKWQIGIESGLQGLAADATYVLRAEVSENGRRVTEFTSDPFGTAALKNGRVSFVRGWKPDKLWDTHTPGNMYQMNVSLLDAGGKVLDTNLPLRFGFREFWIEGRDFYLNGTRIFLSALPLDNAQVGAMTATYDGALESLKRLQRSGINFVYTHNYDCNPGSHLSFTEVLQACDDAGMLVALSQPHYGHYEWKAEDADKSNGYAEHARFYVRAAQNHPSVVAYATSHNATGYADDMNPDMIDGWDNAGRRGNPANVERALRAEAIIKSIDSSRIVYHHSSGNLSSMHTSNFYPNWVPVQEMSDWFEHWATEGVKPVFLCEYGTPFTWDFSMYRGWYMGGRTYGSAVVPWELCLAEWNAQLYGDEAYKITDVEKTCLRWEAEQFRAGRLWHRWDYPYEMGERRFSEQYPAMAMYIADNWRAFRTWGLSANSPWEHGAYWKEREGIPAGRRDLPVDWNDLQRPGFSPDYLDSQQVRVDLAYDYSDWLPTPAADALLRNNMPLLAYLAGKPARFTSKDHIFCPTETVEKQLIVINNSRETVSCESKWSLGLPTPIVGSTKITLPTGEQKRVPLKFELPTSLAPGEYTLTMTAAFSTGETQNDTFAIRVIPRPVNRKTSGRIALYDPRGETAALLRGMGVSVDPVKADADLAACDILILGKGAVSVDEPLPDVSRVTGGLKVIVFEQTALALEKRLGLRVTEYGLRQVFARVPDHPLVAGLDHELLRDWRGAATILPPRLEYVRRAGEAPTIRWCGLEVSKLWRCGCWGNVASVLIEKPGRGDFLPIIDGGYSLQYSPLMEYREGEGMILFCQMDVTGRTDAEPVAEILARRIVQYVCDWKPAPRREVMYVGDPAGRRHLEFTGVASSAYEGGALSTDHVLVVGRGGGEKLAASSKSVARFLDDGGHLLALGLEEPEAVAFLPYDVNIQEGEHIASFFEAQGKDSPLAGVGPADIHNRDVRELPLVRSGATPIGDGVLALGKNANVVFCQLPPYDVTSAEGAIPSLVIDDGDAAEGKQSAFVTMGPASQTGVQFGQKATRAGKPGETYTFAILIKGVDRPIRLHLEIERAGSPWDRALKTDPVLIGTDEWTELHATFQVTKTYEQGWQAYIGCAQDGGRFRADRFRLYQGEYVAWQTADRNPDPPENLFVNAGFEEGPKSYFFRSRENRNKRRTYRRTSFLVNRVLANMGVQGTNPLLANLSTPPGGEAAEPLVKNGDFSVDEDGDGVADGWNCSISGEDKVCAREKVSPDSDEWCQRATSGKPDANGRSGVSLAQHDVPVKEGQWYRVSFKMRSEGMDPGSSVTFTVVTLTNWSALFDYQKFIPEQTWRRFTFLVKGKKTGETKTRFQIWHSGVGTAWYSDVQMQAIDPPHLGRWLDGLYVDAPEDWDYPYRFFRW